MIRIFHCLEGCSDCCVYREYFPSKEYGKIGVLVLPEEKQDIEEKAKVLGLRITILPRIGIGTLDNSVGPEEILAYQLMGSEINGNLCPFLDMKTEKRSPHGGQFCQIYKTRPLACQAYPVISNSGSNLLLDSKCAFSCKYGNSCTPQPMESELIALNRIKNSVTLHSECNIWRYATGVGDDKYKKYFLTEGWYLQK